MITINRYDENSIVPNFKNKEFFTKAPDFVGDEHQFDERLIYAAQAIRDFCGCPVNVNSTYRTPKDNLKEGGAPNSEHLYFKAIDLQVNDKAKNIQDQIELKGELYQKLRGIGVNGFGIGKSMIHLDTRTGGYQVDNVNGSYALWYYPPVTKGNI
jgi:uncharacterized protein YcbK (DUF882 family)